MSFFWDSGYGTRIERRNDAETEMVIRDWSQKYDQNAVLKYSGSWVRFIARSLSSAETWVRNRAKLEKSQSKLLVGLSKQLNALQVSILPYVLAAIDALKGVSFRLAVLFVGVPTLFIFVIVGVTDGLVRREVRRLSGGRESSWLYDYSRRLAVPLILCSCGFYVVWPWTLHPAWGIVSACVFGATAATLAVSRLKKYL